MNNFDPSFIKNLTISDEDLKVDATDVNNLGSRIVSEKQTRQKFLNEARKMGCEKEMFLILSKYDNLLRNCTNDKERKDIAHLGCVEVYRLLGGGGELYVDGQLVIKDNWGKDNWGK